MRIKSARFKNFRRLSLANIDDIQMEFASPYQLWMGTNGCGKTSMLQLLSGLPKETKDFDKDGEFEITLEEQGREFVCRSVRHGSAMRHYFEVDGQNENPGFTAAVQKDLCRRYFGLTPELMGIINNSERFTTMSVNQRRQFFTRLSPTDLTFAQNTFQELKKKHRSAVGALEWVERRIDQESRKLCTPEQLAEYQQTAEVLHRELEVCLQNRPTYGGTSVQDLIRGFEESVRRVQELANSVAAHDPGCTIPWSSYEEIVNAQHRASADRDAIANVYRTVAAEAEADQRVTAAVQGGTENRADLLLRITKLEQELQSFPRALQEFPAENIRALVEDFECCKTPLLDTLSKLPDPTVEDFSRAKQESVSARLEALRHEISKTTHALEQGQRRLQHIEHAKSETCPACDHRFQPGVARGEREDLATYLGKQADLHAHQLGEQAGLTEYWVLAQEFEQGLQQLRQYLSTFPRLQGLWQQLTLRDSNPRGLIPVVVQYEHTLRQRAAYRGGEVELERAQQTLAVLDAQESDEVRHARQRLERAEVRLLELKGEREEAEQRYQAATECRRYVDRWSKEVEEMWATQATSAQVWDAYLQELRREELNGVIQDHQSQLSQINSVQREQSIVAGVLEELQQQRTELQQQVEGYALLIAELSPNDGLIAEQLSGFIAEFTSKMNALLGKIWTYPMMVLPCGIDKGELTYRFPVVFPDDPDFRTADVAETSSAQSDILDFVFKLTVLIYLRIENMPLYIDELGRSFDPVHRQRVLQFVTDYVELGKAPQVFWISHYLSNSAAWPEAEVCVVHSGNVEISRAYNQHVKIK